MYKGRERKGGVMRERERILRVDVEGRRRQEEKLNSVC